MKKAMLSQPMAGKSEEEIIATREKAIKALKEKGFEIVNTLFTDEWYSKEKMTERGVVQIPLCFLASLWRICLSATRPISARDGKIPVVAKLNTKLQRLTDWRLYTKSNQSSEVCDRCSS